MAAVELVPLTFDSPLITIANWQSLPNGEVIGACVAITCSLQECRQERTTMLSCGIDTHQKMHQAEIQNQDGKAMWRGQVSNDRKGFDTLLEKLQTIEKSNSDHITGIFMNPTGNYHMPVQHFLESKGFIVRYVDARITDYARKMANLGKEKSDKVDAAMLASTPWKNKEATDRPIHHRDPVSGLTRMHQSVVENVTRITNILESDLACIFPEYTNMFPDMGSKTSLALLHKFTTPAGMVKAGIDSVMKVMQKSSRNHCRKDDAQKLINLAGESIGIPDPDGIYAFRIRENVLRLALEQERVREIGERILKITRNDESIKIIDDMRGIGPINAAAIVSEIGGIGQFDSAEKLQAYGGKAPNMTGSSGKDHATGLSKIRNPYLSSTVHQCAVSLVNHKNEEFLMIFEREIAKGKKKTQAYVVVSRRLLYHIYSMLKNGKPYRKRSPIMKGREGNFSTAS